MIKKIVLAYLISALLPAYCLAQTAVFKCEENGHTAWSEYPCKNKGKAVRISPLGNGKAKKIPNTDKSKVVDNSRNKQ